MDVDPNANSAFRFSPISDNDHAGNLWILAILATAYSLLAALIRLRIKWGVLGADDVLFGIAMVFLMAQSGVIFTSLSQGLGKANLIASASQWEASGRAFLQSEILSVLVLALCKCSIVALTLRVFSVARGKAWLACHLLHLLCIVWAVGTVVGLARDCEASSVLAVSQSSCRQNQAITAGDMITEIAISTLPAILLWRVNMGVGAKTQVIFAFAFRLPLVALSALHLSYMAHLAASDEPLLAVVSPLVVQQAMLTWSLVSATIPNMKRFMKSFDMDFGMGVPRSDGIQISTDSPAPCAAARPPSSSYPLQTRKNQRDSSRLALRPDSVQYKASAEAQDVGLADEGSSLSKTGSQEMIIRKDVQWKVSVQ